MKDVSMLVTVGVVKSEGTKNFEILYSIVKIKLIIFINQHILLA